MNATIQMIAITGGPMRITKRSSARVLALHRSNGRLNTCHKPAAADVATALTANNIARTRVMPSNSYMINSFDEALSSFPEPDDRVRPTVHDLFRLSCPQCTREPAQPHRHHAPTVRR